MEAYMNIRIGNRIATLRKRQQITQAQLAEAIQYGAQDFIVKPFQEDRMIAAIEKVLS